MPRTKTSNTLHQMKTSLALIQHVGIHYKVGTQSFKNHTTPRQHTTSFSNTSTQTTSINTTSYKVKLFIPHPQPRDASFKRAIIEEYKKPHHPASQTSHHKESPTVTLPSI